MPFCDHPPFSPHFGVPPKNHPRKDRNRPWQIMPLFGPRDRAARSRGGRSAGRRRRPRAARRSVGRSAGRPVGRSAGRRRRPCAARRSVGRSAGRRGAARAPRRPEGPPWAPRPAFRAGRRASLGPPAPAFAPAGGRKGPPWGLSRPPGAGSCSRGVFFLCFLLQIALSGLDAGGKIRLTLPLLLFSYIRLRSY